MFVKICLLNEVETLFFKENCDEEVIGFNIGSWDSLNGERSGDQDLSERCV